jgi:hypothetical protein
MEVHQVRPPDRLTPISIRSEMSAALIPSRVDVPIAEAQIAIAKLFPDPQLTGGIDSYDLTDQKVPTALTWGLSQTIELGEARRPDRRGSQRDPHA